MSHNIIAISDAGDPRIAAYQNLKERELAREGGRFIAEGEMVVRRLLASDFRTESVLLAEERAARVLDLVPHETQVYVAPHQVVNRIVGFKFHSGIIAAGLRKPPLRLEEAAEMWGARPLTLVVLPQVAATDNLGSLIRISSGFGADAIVLGEECCDPFYRQAIRVSMGTVFRVPIIQSQDILADLKGLREKHGVQLLATVLDESAEELATARRPGRIGLLLGNEAQGLSPQHIAACDRRITIPMRLGTDSLNVSVAAGIFLYHFTHYATA